MIWDKAAECRSPKEMEALQLQKTPGTGNPALYTGSVFTAENLTKRE